MHSCIRTQFRKRTIEGIFFFFANDDNLTMTANTTNGDEINEVTGRVSKRGRDVRGEINGLLVKKLDSVFKSFGALLIRENREMLFDDRFKPTGEKSLRERYKSAENFVKVTLNKADTSLNAFCHETKRNPFSKHRHPLVS